MSEFQDLQKYYDLRAPEYEQIYFRDDPLRQRELNQMKEFVSTQLKGRRVLEIACGTGYWTEILSKTAESVVAIDSSEQMLKIAREKKYGSNKVKFKLGDAYVLHELSGSFDGGFAGFWISHVPRAHLNDFFGSFQSKLRPGSPVCMADNVFLPGLGGDLIRPKDKEDTFKIRRLEDGSEHHVLKNYYNEAELRTLLSSHAEDLELHWGDYYWWITYLTA